MPLRLRLGRLKQRHEHRPLPRDPLVERQVDRVPDQLDRFLPGLEAAEFARVRFADVLENLWMAARRLELPGSIAHFLERRLLSRQTSGESDRGFSELAFLGEFVDDPPFLRFARAERRSGENDVERLLDADQPRQALCAAGAGDEAELDLGQSAFRRGDGDAVMRGQRHLESAAERGSMQRRDDRLRRVLDPIEHIGEIRRGMRLAELGDVRPGNEGAPSADDDGRLDRAVRLGRLDAAFQAVSDGLRQRVDRRRVDRDGRHLAFDRQFGDGADRDHGLLRAGGTSSRPADKTPGGFGRHVWSRRPRLVNTPPDWHNRALGARRRKTVLL